MAQSTIASTASLSALGDGVRPLREPRRSECSQPVGSEPLSRFQVPDEAELDPQLVPIYAEFLGSYGFVPNWLRALSVNPDTAVRLVQFQ